MQNPDFSSADPPWTRSSPFSKFLKNSRNMSKRCIHALQTLKKHDCFPKDKLYEILLEYDVKDHLLAAIKLLYKQSDVCVCANGMKTKSLVVVVVVVV